MTLRQKLDNILTAEIYKLTFNTKVVGLRVKLFNLSTGEFEYYDFTLQTVSGNQHMRDFVNSIQKGLSCIELQECNGVFASQEEISGVIIVREFKDEVNAVSVLSQVEKVYKYKG